MAIVVFLWARYFNSIVVPPTTSAAADGSSHISFFDTVREGAAAMYSAAAGQIQQLRDAITAPRTYTIEPEK
jgi:hypothetical protein